jgi:DNA-directed RNA polymerase subunit RPC12/RpoP
MSDSTIDDALKLLEIGKGNPDRLKQIIESFQKKSMISMQDRKYVDALVEQYLTPRHRQMTSKMKTSERQKTNFPRIRKTTESSFKITEVKATSENPHIKPTIEEEKPTQNNSNSCKKCGSKILENNTFCTECGEKFENDESTRIIELTSKEPTIEEKFIEHVETEHTVTKKSGKGKLAGIIIGIIAIIVIGAGAVYVGSSSDLFSGIPDVEERTTCQDNTMLISTTKVPNFPAPGKDLEYYQDRYDNEPKYKEWFDKNFPGQTVSEVLLPSVGDKETIVSGFPDPEKDLQHYLDRYDNEPKYKEWFDKNFPGQTVREAVC